jgi:hypothetical protein
MNTLERTIEVPEVGDGAALRDEQYLVEWLRTNRALGHVGLLCYWLKKDDRLRHSIFPHIRNNMEEEHF